ncbi:hypothetical protein FOTG_14329 [Fusarium oxysporum f. sp. vasinfectum 25433]|uniref:Uncharacterized protein n=1 Tax=Fusarium oxysporum f. sp. vasinfectum 25433 TaxID=1089449 RepID=X0MA25_FUSOX|nr:hypothetical protein FOTG_14329 [Fusarium oxysporum f. sp. vasinfectum 25433]
MSPRCLGRNHRVPIMHHGETVYGMQIEQCPWLTIWGNT